MCCLHLSKAPLLIEEKGSNCKPQIKKKQKKKKFLHEYLQWSKLTCYRSTGANIFITVEIWGIHLTVLMKKIPKGGGKKRTL